MQVFETNKINNDSQFLFRYYDLFSMLLEPAGKLEICGIIYIVGTHFIYCWNTVLYIAGAHLYLMLEHIYI